MISNKVTKLIVLGNYLPSLRVHFQPRLLTGPETVSTGVKNASIHTSCQQYYPGQDWRKKRGMSANSNTYGPLTDGPDYSFLDGRPTPPGTGKIRRAMEQKEIATKIMKLHGEVDFAVEYHETRVKQREAQRKEIIDGKLKPKGRLPPEVFSK